VAGGAPVTEAAAAFGYSRPAYYAAAAALESSGLDGLVPARPGPRGASKLTEEILAWAEEQLAADPGLRPAQLPDRIEDAFGVRVHPRSVERALARRRERHSKSRGTARPRDAEGG
jgi:transposase